MTTMWIAILLILLGIAVFVATVFIIAFGAVASILGGIFEAFTRR